MATPASSARARAHDILRHSSFSPAAQRWRAFHLVVLGVGLLAVALSSIDRLSDDVQRSLTATIVVVAVIFFVEFVVRLWVAPEALRYAGMSATAARLRWA
ncbi:MAG: hypothetical protein JSR47_15285, partial [Proteobacteria bacterium]|nr:hypothetical protein [Pseudomonadota bacterium]